LPKVVELENERSFVLNFGGKEFKEALEFVKKLEGRLFISSKKHWTVPISLDIINKLKANNWKFIEGAYDIAYGNSKSKFVIGKREIPLVPLDKKLCNKELRQYQFEAIQKICGLKGRAILSFPPGCGKTAVAASYFRYRIEHTPVLVVCPAFLKIHWQRELLSWGGLGSYICSGRKVNRPSSKYPVWIINYDIIQYWQDAIIGQHFNTIIIDECQYVANTEAQRTDSIIQISKNIKQIIAISGTPIKNRPKEFYTVLHLIDPKTFNNRWNYLQRYCNPQYTPFGLQFNGATNVDELHILVSNYMIRKEKEELLPELPKKTRYVIPMELSKPEVYKEAEEEIELLIKQNKNKEAHEKLMELSNTAFPLKKESLIAWINNWLEENENESLVIMAYHHAVIDYLKDTYEDATVIDGRVPTESRQALVDKFQKGDYRILIGQIQAAGVGFTFTKASTMVIAEVCYVPGDLEQAEDRIHRLTQLDDHVSIYYLVGEKTIEDAMLNSIQKKTNNLSRILDGKGSKFFE
jgi:SWI/SNF-related matrix-associated actin-dependent regulator of chromatin subfamily A-like protein 1